MLKSNDQTHCDSNRNHKCEQHTECFWHCIAYKNVSHLLSAVVLVVRWHIRATGDVPLRRVAPDTAALTTLLCLALATAACAEAEVVVPHEAALAGTKGFLQADTSSSSAGGRQVSMRSGGDTKAAAAAAAATAAGMCVHVFISMCAGSDWLAAAASKTVRPTAGVSRPSHRLINMHRLGGCRQQQHQRQRLTCCSQV
jgi:hypothetical protein